VFGTTLTNAIGPVGGPGNDLQSIVVADTTWTPEGMMILIDPKGANPERHRVQKVVNGTTIKVAGIKFAHAAAVFIQLAMPCVSVFIQCKEGNVGAVYIGTKSTMVKATGKYCLAILEFTSSGVQPFNFSDPQYGSVNGMESADYWFDGTTSDNILPSLTIL